MKKTNVLERALELVFTFSECQTHCRQETTDRMLAIPGDIAAVMVTTRPETLPQAVMV